MSGTDSHGHGHTPAAWTGVIIAFVGFCVAGAFMVMADPVGFWAGFGLIVLGPVVGGIMSAAGLGKGKMVDQRQVVARSEEATETQATTTTQAAAQPQATPQPQAATSES